jgi:hypothetical protein
MCTRNPETCCMAICNNKNICAYETNCLSEANVIMLFKNGLISEVQKNYYIDYVINKKSFSPCRDNIPLKNNYDYDMPRKFDNRNWLKTINKRKKKSIFKRGIYQAINGYKTIQNNSVQEYYDTSEIDIEACRAKAIIMNKEIMERDEYKCVKCGETNLEYLKICIISHKYPIIDCNFETICEICNNKENIKKGILNENKM